MFPTSDIMIEPPLLNHFVARREEGLWIQRSKWGNCLADQASINAGQYYSIQMNTRHYALPRHWTRASPLSTFDTVTEFADGQEAVYLETVMAPTAVSVTVSNSGPDPRSSPPPGCQPSLYYQTQELRPCAKPSTKSYRIFSTHHSGRSQSIPCGWMWRGSPRSVSTTIATSRLPQQRAFCGEAGLPARETDAGAS